MKMNIFIIPIILGLVNCTQPNETAQEIEKKTFKFQDYRIETGHCDSKSEIRIFKENKEVFYLCGGEGFYSDIDTLRLNQDQVLDFIFVYAWEDYATLGSLVSTTQDNTITYKSFEIKDFFFADIYCNIAPEDVEYVQDFFIADIDNDEKEDILINILYKEAALVPIPGCTDTVTNQQLQKRLIELD